MLYTNMQNIKIKNDEIINELGYKIDWWEFKNGHSQREWLAIVLKYLH